MSNYDVEGFCMDLGSLVPRLHQAELRILSLILLDQIRGSVKLEKTARQTQSSRYIPWEPSQIEFVEPKMTEPVLVFGNLHRQHSELMEPDEEIKSINMRLKILVLEEIENDGLSAFDQLRKEHLMAKRRRLVSEDEPSANEIKELELLKSIVDQQKSLLEEIKDLKREQGKHGSQETY